MKKLITLNIIFIALCVALGMTYSLYGGLLVKGLASLCFVALGAINLNYARKTRGEKHKYEMVIVAGLFVCMIADVVLNLNFIAGALIFAAGHIFYFSAYCYLEKFKARDAGFGIVIFAAAAMFIMTAPIFDFGSLVMQSVCLAYAAIISGMLGKALSNFIRNKCLVNTVLAVGSLLFFFSDLMLSLDVFASGGKVTGILCLATYFPAQCVIACSLLAGQKKK